MIKNKRKTDEGEAASPKKKKVQFAKVNDQKKENVEKKLKKDGEKKMKKDGTNTFKKDGKKFNKPENGKGNVKFVKEHGDKPKWSGVKKDGQKGKKNFNNKPGSFKGKSNFSKDKKNGKDTSQSGEKPKWSEMKKEKKQLRIVRRKAKATAEVFEISHKAKLLAAQIQRKVVKPEFRLNSCKELHCLLKGQYKSIALTHDLSRVIQVLLKYCPEDIKTEITEELLELMVQMAQSKYAHHAVKRILKYGNDFIRHEVIKTFFGHIVSLASHSISAPVLDYAYGEFANKKEKLHMQQEFYGDIYKSAKDDKVKTLRDAYKDSPEMRAAILQSCKANIQRILDKNLHDSELFQSVVYDYMQECSSEERAELVSTLSPLVVPLSNSLPGVNAACLCVWQGTNKDKKTILKVVKEHAVPLARHRWAHRLLLAVFASVDDTVLVRRALVAALAAHLADLADDHWGNMTLHWLVKPKDPAVFHPSLIKFLEDGATSGTSKKDADIRVAELREAILPPLHTHMQTEPEFWLSGKLTMLLAVTVLSVESSKETVEALAKAICRADWKVKVDDKEILAVEDAGTHMYLKKLAALDKDKEEATLGEAICEHLDSETIKLWLPTNRGCFFLLKLIESNKEDVAKKIISKLKPHVNVLKQQSSQGAKLLLQNVVKK